MRHYKPYLVWILIVGGLLWGYEGLFGTNLLGIVFSQQIAGVIEIIVGLAALALAYLKITSGKKK